MVDVVVVVVVVVVAVVVVAVVVVVVVVVVAAIAVLSSGRNSSSSSNTLTWTLFSKIRTLSQIAHSADIVCIRHHHGCHRGHSSTIMT